MEKKLHYDYMEYSSVFSVAIYFRKPLTAAQLRQAYPQLKGIVFEFDRSTFEPKRFDHQQLLEEILEEFDFQEVGFASYGRVTHLPLQLWKPALELLDMGFRPKDFPLLPPSGFQSRLSALSSNGSQFISPVLLGSEHLKRVAISNCSSDLSALSVSTNLEELYLNNNATEPNALHFSGWKQLRKLELQNFPKTQFLPDFTALESLERLRMSNFPALKKLPAGLAKLPRLKEIFLYSIGSQETKIPFQEPAFPALETLSISRCAFSFDDHLSCSAPVLKVLEWYEDHLDNIPGLFFQQTLERVNLHFLQALNLPVEFLRCTQVQQVHLFVPKIRNFGSDWSAFRRLVGVVLNTNEPDSLPHFGAGFPTIQHINIHTTSETVFPDAWSDCPGLETLELKAQPLRWPHAWRSFPSLLRLNLYQQEGKFVLNRNLANFHQIKTINLHGDFSGRDAAFASKVNELLTKTSATVEQRLAFGQLIFEDNTSADSLSDDFKSTLLQAINLGNSQLKEFIWSRLHLLNPKGKSIVELKDWQRKTLFIAGKTRLPKNDYKSKLEALGVKVTASLKSDTNIILAGAGIPEIPNDFWQHEHWFCGETEMEQALKELQPGFLQDLPVENHEALRQLLWSNDPANERLVLEMIKQGGLPEAVIPDLVVVAKTSRDAALRADLRNHLKAKVSDSYKAILSDTRDLERIMERWRYMNNLRPNGLSDMLLAHFRRTGDNNWLSAFFKYRASLDHPQRGLLFEELYHSLVSRPHYLDFREYILNQAELNRVLEEPTLKGQLKRLIVKYAGEELPSALLMHTTLQELILYCQLSILTAEIGQFTKLQKLEVYSASLYKLPAALNKLTKLKTWSFYTSRPESEWQVPKEITDHFEGRLGLRYNEHTFGNMLNE
jgi:hypothetical protein